MEIELLLLLAAEAITEAAGGITASDIVNFVAALGLGGVIVAAINAIAKRKTQAAEAENISASTQTMLSELIDSSTATLRQSVKDQQDLINRQKSRIEALESMITELRRELDESVLIQRLRDAEQDNIYLRGRVKTLMTRIDILREENEEFVKRIRESSDAKLPPVSKVEDDDGF